MKKTSLIALFFWIVIFTSVFVFGQWSDSLLFDVIQSIPTNVINESGHDLLAGVIAACSASLLTLFVWLVWNRLNKRR